MGDVKSTAKVEVVKLNKIKKHPNADSLGITMIHGGYPVVVRLEDWKEGDLGAYIPPDNLVPLDRKEFEWLSQRLESSKILNGRAYHKVKTIRLRKELSMGLLIPAPKGAGIGDNVADFLEVVHYDPQPQDTLKVVRRGPVEKAPFVNPPVYDIDALRRYSEVMVEGEEVYVTEKIHGANARYLWEDRGIFEIYRGRGFRFDLWYVGLEGVRRLPREARYLRVGSRTQWKRFNPAWRTLGEVNDVWWQAALQNPQISRLLEKDPGETLYGEIFGKIQILHYGTPGAVRFAAFDIRRPGHPPSFIPSIRLIPILEKFGIPRVPVLYVGPYSFAKMEELAEGPSVVEGADHVREGVVIKPVQERYDSILGRVILKMVGTGYYEKVKE